MILSIGGATRDIIFKTKEGEIISNPQDPLREKLIAFEYGAKIKVEEVYSSFGGGASNVALGLRRLGYKVKVLVRVGRDEEGRRIKSNFKKEGIIYSAVQSDRYHTTGFSAIIVFAADDEHTAFLYRGANDYLEIKTKDFAHIKYIYLSSLTGKGVREKMERILELALQRQIRIFFNPGTDQLKSDKDTLKKFLHHTTVLIVNLDEAREIALYFGLEKEQLEYNAIFQLLKSLGPSLVVITNAEHGARAYDGNKEYHCPSSFPPVKVVDTTGAGDAFAAGLVGRFLLDTKDIGQALKWGVLNAENVIQYYGAQQGLLTKIQMINKAREE